MKYLSLLALGSFLLAPAVHAQGTISGLSALSAHRMTTGEVHGYDYEFDDAELLTASDNSTTGSWFSETDLEFQDYYGIDVGRGRATQDSTIAPTFLDFDLVAQASTAGNLFSEDSRAEAAFEVMFRTTEPLRFQLNAQGSVSYGYNEVNVELFAVGAPYDELAELHIIGGLGSPSGMVSRTGWLPPGDYILRANAEAFAGLGSMGDADSQVADALGHLRLFHECDFDMDGDLDLDDRQAYLQEWLAGGDEELTDIDGDGDSDRRDAVRFIIHWRHGLRD